MKVVSQRSFIGVCGLVFAAGAGMTIYYCAAMPAMGRMPMPGGWAMSMTGMRMPGQTWPGAAASFLGMWVAMMVAMMLPSLMPTLLRYRAAVGDRGEARLGLLTALAALCYFFVWAVFGMAAFPVSLALPAALMRTPAPARAVPMAIAAIVLLAGAFQFSASKAHHLARCRAGPQCRRNRGGGSASGRDSRLPATFGTASLYGLRLGLHCCYCCAGLTTILLVMGVMNLPAMAVVAAVSATERLAPAGERVAHIIGFGLIGAGLFLIAATWLR